MDARNLNASSTAGTTLSAAVALLGRITGRVKPFHPHGELWEATLTRSAPRPGDPPSGVTWIDRPGTQDSLVRLSAGVGLPRGWPDVHGLALAVGSGTERADVLLASTGTGVLSRHVLHPTRAADARALTTLVPYSSARGPIYLSARPRPRRPGGHGGSGPAYVLAWADLRGPWHPFALLELTAARGDGDRISFDPVLHVPHGLRQYGWVRSLREPAYHRARVRSGREVRGPAAPRTPGRC